MLGFDSEDRLEVHAITVGEFVLVGISAELTNVYLRLAQQAFLGMDVFPVGCIDNVIGYLPANSMFSKSGYESDGFCAYFDVKGRYTGDIEASVTELMKTVRAEIG